VEIFETESFQRRVTNNGQKFKQGGSKFHQDNENFGVDESAKKGLDNLRIRSGEVFTLQPRAGRNKESFNS